MRQPGNYLWQTRQVEFESDSDSDLLTGRLANPSPQVGPFGGHPVLPDQFTFLLHHKLLVVGIVYTIL